MSESVPRCGGGDGRTGLACSSSAGSLRGVSAGYPLWFQPAASPRASWAQQSMVVRTPALAGSGWELAQPLLGRGLLGVIDWRDGGLAWSADLFLLDTLCPTWGRPHRRSSFPAGPTRERPKSRFPTWGAGCDTAKRAYGSAWRLTRQTSPGNTGLASASGIVCHWPLIHYNSLSVPPPPPKNWGGGGVLIRVN